MPVGQGSLLLSVELTDGTVLQVGTAIGIRAMTLEAATVRIDQQNSLPWHIPLNRVLVMHETPPQNFDPS